jgi:Ni/Fe-hydrogenase subunit HybB-like protein
MNNTGYHVAPAQGFWLFVLILVPMVIAALWSAHQMDTAGHAITGMNNQVVWGLPHVFAVFLILCASGTLNPASLSTVFGRTRYAPIARLSSVFAICLLVGGLVVLVLDLGRPDRLQVAITTYNFRSIFAWNVFGYTGFIVIVGVYLACSMDNAPRGAVKTAGYVAFAWRILLTSGTGAIFGFLVAREAYDAAILVPLFVATSFALGTAIFLIGLVLSFRWSGQVPDPDVLNKLGRLLAIFVLVVLCLVAVQTLISLYGGRQRGVVEFLLFSGGVYPVLFWLGQVGLGSILPLMLLYSPRSRGCASILTASALVMVGGLCQLYVLIIGGQVYPLRIFPGYRSSSSFFDGVVADYAPTLWEVLLGFGGVAMAVLLCLVAMRTLPLLPRALPLKPGTLVRDP